MSTRIVLIASAMLLLVTAAFAKKTVDNPLANVGSKQPDKVLFDRAMEQMKHNRFDQAQLILQTLINSYPDSEYIARAKLAVSDCWYAEGGMTSLAQAELGYKDFITFFPNMPEAAEAQLKIADIHYQQMEKPGRDFIHAMRAQEEYRRMILQFPDSKLLLGAKQRLLEVQEVLAQREFQIGRFYYLRNSYPAAIARLQSVIDSYPLFSGADEALYLLGRSYEGQIANIRASKMPDAGKAKLIQEFANNGSAAYSKILTRYPVMDRARDAKGRLLALHQPVAIATQAAIAQNQREEYSRRRQGRFAHLMDNFSRHPDVAQAIKVGEPSLVDLKPVSATELVAAADVALFGNSSSSNNKVWVESVQESAPPTNGLARHSDAAAPSTEPNTTNKPANTRQATAEVETVRASNDSTPTPAAYPPGLPQVNEIQQDSQEQGDSSNTISPSASRASTDQNTAKDNFRGVCSSKEKKRKRKLFF